MCEMRLGLRGFSRLCCILSLIDDALGFFLGASITSPAFCLADSSAGPAFCLALSTASLAVTDDLSFNSWPFSTARWNQPFGGLTRL